MKRICSIVFMFLMLKASILLAAETGIAIVGAAAYTPANAEPVKNTTIIIKAGKITAMGENIPVPKGIRIIDAKGQLVTPGLMNAITRLGLTEIEAISATQDYSLTEGPLGAAFNVKYALNPNSTLIPAARADGLTRALTAPSASADAPFAGIGAALQLNDGPNILDKPDAAMFVKVGGASAGAVGGSRSAEWILLRNALDEAVEFSRQSAASRRNRGDNELLNRLNVEALQPVIAGKMPLVIAASRESDIRQVVLLAQDYKKLRIVLLGGTEAWRVADLLAERRIPVIIDPFNNVPFSFDELGATLRNAALLEQAGVLVAIAVKSLIDISHNAGLSIRKAAGLAVANGMSWSGAMNAITVNPAKIWGIADRYGTLEVGKEADIVLWNGDPFEVMTRPQTVLVGGQEVSLQTRQTLLRDRYAPDALSSPIPPAYR